MEDLGWTTYLHAVPRHEGHSEEKPPGGVPFHVSDRVMASVFWYVIGALVTILFLGRYLPAAIRRLRHGAALDGCFIPARWWESFATRNSRRQCTLGSPLQWLSPPSLGKSLALLLYFAFCAVLLLFGLGDRNGLEGRALRAGWVSLVQVPLLFLLVSRQSVLALLVGSSYERVNWIHRWVARVVFLTVTLHGALFMAEWIPNSFFWREMDEMPNVPHGFYAWVILLWTGISASGPLRRLSHEFFVRQHVLSAALFLLFLYWHLPGHHNFTAVVAAAIFLANLLVATVAATYRNVHIPLSLPLLSLEGGWQRPCSRHGRKFRLGYEASATAVGEDVTVLDIKGVHFTWQPGQHVAVRVPRLGFHSAHSFTPIDSCEFAEINDDDKNENENGTENEDNNSNSNINIRTETDTRCRTIRIVMRTKTGVTRALNRLARHTSSNSNDDRSNTPLGLRVRVLLSGPFGAPPRFHVHDHDGGDFGAVALVSASTGASFTLPILEAILLGSGDGNGNVNASSRSRRRRVRYVRMLLVARRRSHIVVYLERVYQLRSLLLDGGGDGNGSGDVFVEVDVAITGGKEGGGGGEEEEEEEMLGIDMDGDGDVSASDRDCLISGDAEQDGEDGEDEERIPPEEENNDNHHDHKNSKYSPSTTTTDKLSAEIETETETETAAAPLLNPTQRPYAKDDDDEDEDEDDEDIELDLHELKPPARAASFIVREHVGRPDLGQYVDDFFAGVVAAGVPLATTADDEAEAGDYMMLPEQREQSQSGQGQGQRGRARVGIAVCGGTALTGAMRGAVYAALVRQRRRRQGGAGLGIDPADVVFHAETFDS